MKKLYDFEVLGMEGKKISLGDYKGKVMLIVNSATKCGFTPQYNDLEKLYEKYNEKGFVVLDFPCNQFNEQAPGSNEEIVTFCQMNFGVSYPMFSKIDVNGENEDPLYTFLKKEQPFNGLNPEHPIAQRLESIIEERDPDFRNNSNIKWNFTKFLVDKEGNVVSRFEPTHDMNDVEEKIKELL
jgi:glutathione peroxidase